MLVSPEGRKQQLENDSDTKRAEVPMKTQLITYEARKAVQIGYENHWRFRVVGTGELPKNSYYKDEWVFVPVEAPQIAHDRLETLKRSGIRFKGFVIAHEAPRVLTAPATIPKKPDFKNKDIVPDVGTMVRDLAMGLLFVFSVVFQAVLLDPALIVILEDGTWLEVMTWYE